MWISVCSVQGVVAAAFALRKVRVAAMHLDVRHRYTLHRKLWLRRIAAACAVRPDGFRWLLVRRAPASSFRRLSRLAHRQAEQARPSSLFSRYSSWLYTVWMPAARDASRVAGALSVFT